MNSPALPAILLAKLQRLAADPGRGAAQRLLHGRGGCHPGLEQVTVEALAPVLAVICHGPPPAWLPALSSAFTHLLAGCGFTHLAIQHRDQLGAPWSWPVGAPLEQSWARLPEGPRLLLRFAAQNFGVFTDAAHLRAWLHCEARAARVLNLFAYTGALSLAALQGGASSVLNVDMSKAALDWARANHLANDWQAPRVTYAPLNVLTSAGRIGRRGPFDLVLIDPPTRQAGSFDAARDYGKVLRRLPGWVAPGGRAALCLNAPNLPWDWLQAQAEQHCPDWVCTRLAPAAEIDERDPDRGLKVLLLTAPR